MYVYIYIYIRDALLSSIYIFKSIHTSPYNFRDSS